jgi:NSS family neurotransmitter:Na+ symporter
MPKLFAQMPAGGLFMTLFFLGLSFAALTSLISMIELASRVLIDGGMARRQAVICVGAAGLLLGLPSALSLDFLHNQDWVWGVGLMLSGLFFAIGARAFGIDRLRTEVVNAEGCDLRLGRWWNVAVAVIVPIEAVVLMGWWLWQARGWDPEGWLDPFRAESAGTVLLQIVTAVVLLLLFNRWLARRMAGQEAGS